MQNCSALFPNAFFWVDAFSASTRNAIGATREKKPEDDDTEIFLRRKLEPKNFRSRFSLFRQTAFLSSSCVHFCHYHPTHCLGCRSIQYRSIAPWQVSNTKVLSCCDVKTHLKQKALMTSLMRIRVSWHRFGTRVTILGAGGGMSPVFEPEPSLSFHCWARTSLSK